MRTQTERDEQTVTIATSLTLLVALMLLGVAVLWVLHLVVDPSTAAQTTILLTALLAAVLVSGGYLLRHRRP